MFFSFCIVFLLHVFDFFLKNEMLIIQITH